MCLLWSVALIRWQRPCTVELGPYLIYVAGSVSMLLCRYVSSVQGGRVCSTGLFTFILHKIFDCAPNIQYRDLSTTTCYPSRIDSSASSLFIWLRGVGFMLGRHNLYFWICQSTRTQKLWLHLVMLESKPGCWLWNLLLKEW